DCGHVGLGTLLALRIVGDAGGNARVLDVSEALAITIGAASKQIDRLERSGLAERRPHPHDRRSSLLSLTAAGARARQA
ncbi:MarR family winged helix-turn-helix transcriptional regulator, partial [Shewanella algae]|uniref:MarR family winged helix-turn-helix transcriptional regulator n=1 Tax=Shewanella algae TaxID=38313 RepID=UPI00313AEE0F